MFIPASIISTKQPGGTASSAPSNIKRKKNACCFSLILSQAKLLNHS